MPLVAPGHRYLAIELRPDVLPDGVQVLVDVGQHGGDAGELPLGLHHAGPGTLQVGPLIVIRTDRELVGTVLAATEASLLDGRAALPAPEECRVLLRNMGRDRLADLGAWADSHS